MLGLNEEMPEPRVIQLALTQLIARELFYAHILDRNAPLTESEVVNRCQRSRGGFTKQK